MFEYSCKSVSTDQPLLSLLLISAPFSSSSLHSDACPFQAAYDKGDLPSCLHKKI